MTGDNLELWTPVVSYGISTLNHMLISGKPSSHQLLWTFYLWYGLACV